MSRRVRYHNSQSSGRNKKDSKRSYSHSSDEEIDEPVRYNRQGVRVWDESDDSKDEQLPVMMDLEDDEFVISSRGNYEQVDEFASDIEGDLDTYEDATERVPGEQLDVFDDPRLVVYIDGIRTQMLVNGREERVRKELLDALILKLMFHIRRLEVAGITDRAVAHAAVLLSSIDDADDFVEWINQPCIRAQFQHPNNQHVHRWYVQRNPNSERLNAFRRKKRKGKNEQAVERYQQLVDPSRQPQDPQAIARMRRISDTRNFGHQNLYPQRYQNGSPPSKRHRR
jgi:hypothetical protein